MGVYKKAVITNAGRALLARSIAGEIVMQFSRAVTSSHIYPSDTDFKGYTSLEGIQQTVIPSNVQVVNDTLISVRALFGNESISESYLIQNIGLYATDGSEEVLFSVSQAATPDEMPAYNGVAPSSFIYTIQATVSQASSLSLTINPAGTATTQDIVDLDDVKLDRQGDVSETVVETLEPFADKFPIPSAGDKIKQFFGKILTFLRNIKPLEADVTYYVATTGSDTTGDGTSAKPFKTIQYALNILPKDLGGYSATIKISDGTYNENILISGFINGNVLLVRSVNQDILNTACNIYKIRGITVSARIFISGINVIASDTDAFSFTNCSNVIIIASQAIISNPNTGFVLDASNIRLEGCRVSNYGYVVRAAYNSQCFSLNWVNSTNNTYGISSINGSIVCCAGNQPSGNIQSRKTEGGGIFFYENGTQISDIISSGLSCAWGTLTGGYVRHGSVTGSAMVTIQCNVVLTTASSTATGYIISGFPKPSSGKNISVSVSAQKWIANAYIDASTGNIVIYFGTALTSGSEVLINVTYATNS